jgi:hypothetical protein
METTRTSIEDGLLGQVHADPVRNHNLPAKRSYRFRR